ncbi:uncharacterized protein LOC115077066 [Rhinatrema bivittatum]|uniref:uncharacterized protein LOC115077066 n=1 Tax=Rhinatrema bivittatum TaxID=194408 RepID=UPI00112B9AFC|nr:uncharacterized protein LOC115077066 [Rhinatrema bivittatum]
MPALLHLCLLLLFSAQGSPAPAEGGNVTVYAPLGGQAEFILYRASLCYDQNACKSMDWRKDITTRVAKFIGSDRTCTDSYKHRCKGYENGSLQLSNLSREDSGYYNVDFHNYSGRLEAKFWFLLEVQGSPAPTEGGNVTVYAALGGQVEFILDMTSPYLCLPSECFIDWRKNISTRVAKFKGSVRICSNVYKHRCKGYENGSLQLSNISREDSGYYSAELYNYQGRFVAKFWFLLEVQEETFSAQNHLQALPVRGALYLSALSVPWIVYCILIRREKN